MFFISCFFACLQTAGLTPMVSAFCFAACPEAFRAAISSGESFALFAALPAVCSTTWAGALASGGTIFPSCTVIGVRPSCIEGIAFSLVCSTVCLAPEQTQSAILFNVSSIELFTLSNWSCQELATSLTVSGLLDPTTFAAVSSAFEVTVAAALLASSTFIVPPRSAATFGPNIKSRKSAKAFVINPLGSCIVSWPLGSLYLKNVLRNAAVSFTNSLPCEKDAATPLIVPTR